MTRALAAVVETEQADPSAEEGPVLDPSALYSMDASYDDPPLDAPVLVQALDGFVDAGQAVRQARTHLLSTLPHRRVATFDVDQLLDYRSRRPPLRFASTYWADYEQPELVLRAVTDPSGQEFLLLSGPEPDVQWERFIAAVTQLVERLGVRLVVGLGAIPLGVPHTRPVGLTAHGTRSELVRDFRPWFHDVQVPSSAGNLLEFRLGQAGHDAVGFAVHVPSYVAQMDFPAAAEVLLQQTGRLAGLALPTDALATAATRVGQDVDRQVAASTEITEVVRQLEKQYDAAVLDREKEVLADDPRELPSGDELGAELERFLAQQHEADRDDDRGTQTG